MEIKIAKADQSVTVDWDNLPESTRDYVINYGLRQALNDAAAPVNSDEADAGNKAMALVVKRLEKMKAGTMAIRESGPRGDSVKAEAIKIALVHLTPVWKKAGKALDPKAMRAAAIKMVEKNVAYVHLAQAAIDRRAEEIAALGDITVDEEELIEE